MPIRAALFDLGNTLIHFDGEWSSMLGEANAALIHSLQSSGLSLDWSAFQVQFRAREQAYYAERDTQFIERTTLYLLNSLLAEFGCPSVDERVLHSAVQALYAVSQAHWQPETDALPMLAELRRRGYRMGMISNASDDTDVQTLVDKGQFRPYLDFVITSAKMGIRKPNPRIFRAALTHWGYVPSEAVMVGDTLGADILGAQLTGIPGIWINRRADTPANRAHRDTIHPDSTITTLTELVPLLESLL